MKTPNSASQKIRIFPLKNVGEIHKEWTAAGVIASRTTTKRRMKDMCFSALPPDSGSLIYKGNATFAFIRKHNFGPLSSSPVLFVLGPGETLLTLFLVQEWLDTRNATAESHVFHASLRGGS